MKPDSNPPLPPLKKFKKGGRLLRDLKKPLFEKDGQGEIYSADF
jgi:hypothetical protein